MNKKIIILCLILFTLFSLGLHVYKNNEVPACINADEAAFGYNAYSLLKTGKDEYGSSLPLRLKSFGDYKLPLYSYLSVPFVALFGLSAFSTRVLANIAGILFPLLMYVVSRKLFKSDKIALISAFLMSVSPWIQTISRQAHEATLAAFFITITLIFFLRFIKSHSLVNGILFSLFNGLSLFSYHISRIFALFFFCSLIIFLIMKRRKISTRLKLIVVSLFFTPLFFFLFSELKYPATRVQNLIFYNNQGFSLKLAELNREHHIEILHNKIIMGLTDLTYEYSKYFSPQFLVIHGDTNTRFGYLGFSPISIVEYVFFFVGLYYLFSLRENKRYFIISLLLIAPLTASLAWQEYSLTRSYYLIVPLTLIIGYGLGKYHEAITNNRYKKTIVTTVAVVLFFSIFNSWDFYFFHYPQRPLTVRSVQCGYKELAQYIHTNYNRFSEFMITQRHGQPYIFLLYFLKFDPSLYQRVARLSAPDEYGFGQVERFDKFNFNFTLDKPQKGIAYIGYPEHFIHNPYIDLQKIKKITIHNEEIFWIYESP